MNKLSNWIKLLVHAMISTKGRATRYEQQGTEGSIDNSLVYKLETLSCWSK